MGEDDEKDWNAVADSAYAEWKQDEAAQTLEGRLARIEKILIKLCVELNCEDFLEEA